MKCFIMNRECTYDLPGHSDRHTRDEPGHDQKTDDIFMVSPFGFPFDDLYEHGIKGTVEDKLKMTISRSNQSLQLGYVMCQRICRPIRGIQWVFADLTEPNANVYYELGLALGLGKRVVLLSRQRSLNPYLPPYMRELGPVLEYRGLQDLRDADALRSKMDHAYLLPDALLAQLRTSSTYIARPWGPADSERGQRRLPRAGFSRNPGE